MASVEKRFARKIMEVLLIHNILVLIFKLNPGFLFLTQGVLGSETGERAKAKDKRAKVEDWFFVLVFNC